MRKLTIENIIPAIHGTYHGDFSILSREIEFITTDSREAGENCLFAAIEGENSDGHDYVNQAFEKGALCVIAEREIPDAAGALIEVKSTEYALRELAMFYRMQYDIPFIGITGSVGKTTTKEMVASVLSQRFNTLKTEKNFNNELGVPLTLFRLQDEDECAVIEMGINHFGEMRNLTRTAMPDMAVFTNIGHSHLEFLGDREGVLKAKSEILEGMPGDAVVFVNGDDDLLREMDCKGRKKVTFGTKNDCDIYADSFVLLGEDGSSCDIVSGERRISIKINAFGAHMVYAALAAAAVGMHMGLSDGEISAGIAAYIPVGSRARVIKTESYTIIDDSYNANPNSVTSAILSMDGMGTRRVCILGDMLELGDGAEKLHYSVGCVAAQAEIDVLLTCGELSENIYNGAKSEGSGIIAWHFPNKSELIAVLPRLIEKGDAILVKASRGMRFEEIVESISLT